MIETTEETTEDSTIRVTVSNVGQEAVIVRLEEGATVEDAMRASGFTTSGRDIYCDAKKAELEYVVQDGDTLMLIQDKIHAGVVAIILNALNA